ncbi:MAG: glycosyltransferase family 4 protein [Candidatus Omnitrophica bacterium]|nr:glycosyltransferase family 4 protein [Candidatus Omnitrophota bacterium]
MYYATIIVEQVKHYSKRFYELAREKARKEGLDLTIIYGDGYREEKEKRDALDIPWGIKIKNKYWTIGSNVLCWQPCLGRVKNADLIIMDQGNKYLANYVLIVKRLLFGKPNLAYWGHGKNFQSEHPNGTKEKIKKRLICHVDWWFAYNDMTVSIVQEAGFPSDRITNMHNSIDTRGVIEAKSALRDDELQQLKEQLAIQEGPVGIFCGSMYDKKRLPFLLKACLTIRKSVPNFQMICIGDGPDRQRIENAASECDWIKCVGMKNNVEKVKYFALADVFLMPGAVGLAVLDSFALKVPMITTHYPYHGPEIAYLHDGINGLIVEDTVEGYSRAVIDILKDKVRYSRLVDGCSKSAALFSVESMADNFIDGLSHCLEYVKRKRGKK